MREPSGENTGLIFKRLSCVSCLGSPSGRILIYTCPGDGFSARVPRTNASMRPSGEIDGWQTESGKLVTCSHSERGAGLPPERIHHRVPTAAAIRTAAAI